MSDPERALWSEYMGVTPLGWGAAIARDRGSRKLRHALCSRQEERMYRIAGIDVHKKKLAVVVADVEVHGEYQFERCWFAANPGQLRLLSQWLAERQVEEVVMESTALYWKPVWKATANYTH